MSVWDSYESRITSLGGTMRNVDFKREVHMINTKLPRNLSYQDVLIDNEPRNVAIIDSDNYNEKTILSMPGDDLRHGALVDWMDNHWIIVEKDANRTLRTRGKLLQCNHLLKWIDENDIIHEQWCVVEDGTKYLTGEYEDRNIVVTRGDTRISVTISKNEETVKFGRECRFLIDDPSSGEKLSYSLTKPLKAGHLYDENNGVYIFVMQEVNSTDYDNFELGIADYYKHFPDGPSADKERRAWI